MSAVWTFLTVTCRGDGILWRRHACGCVQECLSADGVSERDHFQSPASFHFVLRDLPLTAFFLHHFETFTKQRCSHRLLCKNLKNSLGCARCLPSPLSVCRSVCLGSPSSKPRTGRDLLFYPQRNSTGGQISAPRDKLLMKSPLTLLSPPPPPEASCRGTPRGTGVSEE